jgi:hypothetical protein
MDEFEERMIDVARLMSPAKALKKPKIARAATKLDFFIAGRWPIAAILCWVVLYSMIAPYESVVYEVLP